MVGKRSGHGCVLFLAVFAGCGSPDASPRASPADASSTDASMASDVVDGAAPSGPDGSEPDASDSRLDAGLSPQLVEFCQKYSTAVCTDRQACGYMLLPPLAACTGQENARCTQQARATVGALSSGRVVFDPSAVDACFADAQKPFCNTNNLGLGVPSCAKVFRGTVPPGGSCYSTYTAISLTGGERLEECAGGACSSTIQLCPGQCIAYLHADDACSPSGGPAQCDPTSYCDGSHCKPLVSLGAPCDGTTLRCNSSLTCGPHDSGDGGLTCETPKEQGQACAYDSECDRFYCLTKTCRPAHQNEPCAAYLKCDPGLRCAGKTGCQPPVALNAACDPSYDACDTGLACERSGTDDAGFQVGSCHAVRSPAEGQPCFNGQCAAGLWCQSTSAVDSVCRAAGKAGQDCLPATDGSCAAGFVCSGSKKCQAPSRVGGPCEPDWTATCAEGLGCGPNMTCEPKVAGGAACDAVGVCPLAYYCDGTCRPAKLPGSSCTGKTGECIGGACDTTAGKCNGDCLDPG